MIQDIRKKRTPSSAVDVLSDNGCLPPQAVDFEIAVLGALLIDRDAILAVVDTLRPEHFYKESHQRIYTAIAYLFSNNNPIDILTVTNRLRETGELEMVGGAYEVTALSSRVGSSLNIDFHSKIIVEKFMRREAIRLSSEHIRMSFDDTVDTLELVEKINIDSLLLTGDVVKRDCSTLGSAIKKSAEHISGILNNDGTAGIPTGFKNIDDRCGGLCEPDLIIIAGRPSMGKTSFMLHMAEHQAVDCNIPVAVFSLEMSEEQLANRLLSKRAGINHSKFRRPKAITEDEWIRYSTAESLLSRVPMFIDDTPAINIHGIRAKSIRMKKMYGIKAIYVDYLQLISSTVTGRSREQEVSAISRGLKGLAKELSVPVIALSQLSRNVEHRAGSSKRPVLSDLRESGAIEQDADVVMFVHNPDVYDVLKEHVDCELLFEKHRHTGVFTEKVVFHKPTASFYDDTLNKNTGNISGTKQTESDDDF